MPLLPNMPLALAAAVFLWLPALAATAQSDQAGALEIEEWERLANRAERVIEAAAASDSALLILRAELQDWRDRALAERDPLTREVSELELRVGALGDGDDAVEVPEEIEARRSELSDRLAQVRAPLLLAEEIIVWSEGLIARVDAILQERRESRLFRSGQSPLMPASWPAAAAHLSGQIGDIRREVAESLSSAAHRQVLRQRLPGITALVLLGFLLLTIARRWADRMLRRAWDRLGATDSVAADGASGFLVGFLLPVAGVQVLVEAAVLADLLLLNADIVELTVPKMAVAVFGASWLGTAIFSGRRVPALPDRLDAGWSASCRLIVYVAGWVFAVRLLADSMLHGVGELSAEAGAAGFPILAAGSAVLFLMGRRLAEHAAAGSAGATERGVADLAVSALSFAAKAAAGAGLVAGVSGLFILARALVFSSILTLALIGFVVVLQAVISNLLSSAIRRAGGGATRDRSGLIHVSTGIVLLAAALPELAVIWGATDKDPSYIWSQLLDGVQIGGQQFTVYTLLTLVAVFAAGYVGTRLVQRILAGSVLPDTDLDVGTQRAVTTGVGYVGIILAIVVGISAAGLDLTNLAIVAGALSVGIGFGLQAVVSNFVSGIILLIERPINVGDWIQTGGVSGTVKRISVRSTVIETFDRAAVVVPNTDLMSGQVVNWTLTNRICRTIVPVGVAYGTNPGRVRELLLEIASEHPAVLKDPAPSVMLMSFGADALEFELRAILDDTDQILRAKSDLNFAIAERFEREGITIPFPQRDVWIRNADAGDAAGRDGNGGNANTGDAAGRDKDGELE